MKDTDFEQDSRKYADHQPETFSEAVAGISPDWDFVVNGHMENDLIINLT
jgi:hypothetical protein